MQKRNTQQRRQAIVDWVNQQGHVQVDDLAGAFKTSEVTIRKDLTVLAEQGLLLRQFGGAAPLPGHPGNNNPQPAERATRTSLSRQKSAIGQCAARLLNNNARIIIDSGSTTASMLPHVIRFSRLVVMTNSLNVANYLTGQDNEPTVLMTGGTWDPLSQSFQGHMAEQVTQAYSFDYAFIGAAGIDAQRGTTTFNELTGLTQTMAKAAQQVVIVAESSKLAHKMPNLELAWQDIDYLVTDNNIDPQIKQAITDQGVQVMIATPNGE